MTDLLQRIEQLSGRVQAVDTRPFEGASATDLLAHVAPPLLDGLDGALALLREARRLYPDAVPDAPASSSESSGAFGLQLDEVMRSQDTRRRVVDVVVLGHIELTGKRAALTALGRDADPWTLLDACASTRRRLLKVLAALRQALGVHHGVPTACAWYRSELELSLAVRGIYTHFRRAVARVPEPGPADVRRRLREAGIQLAVLIGRDLYEYARTSDRRQIRAVQERVLAWLRDREPSPRLGVRVWQDFAALAGLLVQINLRAELREHDLDLAAAVAARLAGGDPDAAIGPAVLAALQPLLGRDDDLDDALAAAGPAAPRGPCRDALRRIAAALAPSAPDAGDPLAALL